MKMVGKVDERMVRVVLGKIVLEGSLAIPESARGIVVFAHGSGSSRLSPRNLFISRYLQQKGLATLLFDLLTREEEEVDCYNMTLRFDIGLLSRRLIATTDWLAAQEATRELDVAYFGASTGAVAAFFAENQRPETVRAIVSRGGRPDLAGQALKRVRAPTLFIVGENDDQILKLNEWAMERMEMPRRLIVVPGATHLFEEAGTLAVVAERTAEWFLQHLDADRPSVP